jgi:TolB-like protein/DNA-binding winged helix-turn-helix (wHTH) protein
MFVLGPAYLDPEKQLLSIGTRSVTLQRKPYLVFLWLIENRHRMVSREELLQRFWGGKEVYDQSLSKAVGSIRRALGEPAGSQLIETRWGFGYRYIGPFSELLPDGSEPGQSAVLRSTAGVAGPLPGMPSSEGLSTSTANPPWSRLPFRDRRSALLGSLLAVCLIVLLAFGAYAHRVQVDAQSVTLGGIHSVAVLPFTADGNDEEGQYLGVELADSVAARLATVSQLSVRSSATVRSILGRQANLAAAGQKLEVQAVVKGEIHRVGDKVVIHIRLLDSSTGAALWAGALNAGTPTIFATEDSIAQHIASALLPQLGMNAFKKSSAPDTLQPQAYSKYMKAKFFSTTRTRESLAKAIYLLNEATAIDPNYARAYAALADCYQLEGFYQFAPPAEAYPRAKAAALKALSLNNSLAEAHVVLLSALAD